MSSTGRRGTRLASGTALLPMNYREQRSRQNSRAGQRNPRVALYSPHDGCAEPWLAVPAMARAARTAGVRVLTQCAVRTVKRAAGRVSSVVTERDTIRCDSAAICCGASSRLFAGNLGLDFPSLKAIGTVARVLGVSGVPDFPVGAENFSFRLRADGQHTLTLRNANIAPVLIDNLILLPRYASHLRNNWSEFKLRFGRSFPEDLAFRGDGRPTTRRFSKRSVRLTRRPPQHSSGGPSATLRKLFQLSQAPG